MGWKQLKKIWYEVKPVEDDDTVVLTQEDKDKIQKELQEQKKQDNEQEENWIKSSFLRWNTLATPEISLIFTPWLRNRQAV